MGDRCGAHSSRDETLRWCCDNVSTEVGPSETDISSREDDDCHGDCGGLRAPQHYATEPYEYPGVTAIYADLACNDR